MPNIDELKFSELNHLANPKPISDQISNTALPESTWNRLSDALSVYEFSHEDVHYWRDTHNELLADYASSPTDALITDIRDVRQSLTGALREASESFHLFRREFQLERANRGLQGADIEALSQFIDQGQLRMNSVNTEFAQRLSGVNLDDFHTAVLLDGLSAPPVAHGPGIVRAPSPPPGIASPNVRAAGPSMRSRSSTPVPQTRASSRSSTPEPEASTSALNVAGPSTPNVGMSGEAPVPPDRALGRRHKVSTEHGPAWLRDGEPVPRTDQLPRTAQGYLYTPHGPSPLQQSTLPSPPSSPSSPPSSLNGDLPSSQGELIRRPRSSSAPPGPSRPEPHQRVKRARSADSIRTGPKPPGRGRKI